MLKPDTRKQFEGAVLKYLREKNGISVKEAAQAIELSVPYVYRVEAGSLTPPRGMTLFKWLDLLKIGPKYFQELVKKHAEGEPVSRTSGVLGHKAAKRPDEATGGRGRAKRVILTADGQVLKQLRLAAGLTVRAASDRLGYSGSGGYVSQIENGRADPPKGDKLDQFLGAYGVSLGRYEQMVRDWRLENDKLHRLKLLLPKLDERGVDLVLSMTERLLADRG